MSAAAEMSAQSVSLEYHQCKSEPPISAPAARWNQNALGLSLALPARRYERPTSSVTTAVQLPPFETRSVTKSHQTTTVIAEMNGKLNRLRSSHATTSTSSKSESRATEKPANGEPLVPCSQPNHVHSAAMNAAHAITDANAKMPAAIQRPRALKAFAIA